MGTNSVLEGDHLSASALREVTEEGGPVSAGGRMLSMEQT